MNASFFSTFWEKIVPPPKFLLMDAAGLEVSEHSVKYLSLIKGRGGFEIETFGSINVPQGVIAGGEIKDAARLEEVIRQVRTRLRSPLVSVSLPEQKGYLFERALPHGEEGSERETLEFLLEEHVPLSPGEAVFDFEITQKTGGSSTAYVTAFPRKTVSAYYETLSRAVCLPLDFEMAAQAAVRGWP